MYLNYSVQVRIGEGLSRLLLFTKGIKQVYVLSLLLFALYISSLETTLHGMREGVSFEGEDNYLGPFLRRQFSSDVKNYTTGDGVHAQICPRFSVAMHMKLLVEKAVLLTSSPRDTVWEVSESESDLESIFLIDMGITILVKGRSLIKEQETIMISTARKYANTIMGYSMIGQVKSWIAYLLWDGNNVHCQIFFSVVMLWLWPKLPFRSWTRFRLWWYGSFFSSPNQFP